MKFLRAGFRLTFFALGAIFNLIRYFALVPFTGPDLSRAMRIRRDYLNLLLRVLGIHLTETGAPPDQPGIYISNHRSYLDPIIFLARVKALPVAKSEVSKWPLIGFGAKASGVLFVQRHDPQSRKNTRQEMGELFKQGYGILIYPEGTTHVHPQTIDFRMGAFKEAIAVQAAVYPVAIAYQHKADAWIGDDTFFRHFFERFGLPRMKVKISYGPKLFADDPVTLRDQTRAWIDEELKRLHQNWSEMAIPLVE